MRQTAMQRSAKERVITGVADGAEALVLADLAREANSTILHVARDDRRMAQIAEGLGFFAKDLPVLTLPAWDSLPYDRVSPNAAILARRVEALATLAASESTGLRVVLTTVNAVLQKVPPREIFRVSTLIACPGDRIGREQIITFLQHKGFVRTGTVTESGEYALRGSIIDILPPGGEEGVRLDFFGDVLESIRNFDPITQITAGNLGRLRLLPASELMLEEEAIRRFRQCYREQFGNAQNDPLFDAISEGRKYTGMEHWLPLFYERMERITDYVPGAAISFDPLAEDAIAERQTQIQDYYQARKEVPAALWKDAAPYHPLPPAMLYVTEEEWSQVRANAETISLTPFETAVHAQDAGFRSIPKFQAEATAAQISIFRLLAEAILKWSQRKPVLISCSSEGSRERMARILEDHEIHAVKRDGPEGIKGQVNLVILRLESGFEGPALVVIAEQDILGERISRAAKKRRRPEKFLAEMAAFTEGELVVHKDHGIGRFEGLETLTVVDSAHDCLRIIYDGGDKLYVPVENMDLITRYGSSEAEVPLDRLGGLAWQQRTAKLKERVKLAAEELMKVAAERALKASDALVPPSGLYEEFAARFPYPETEDQLRAIEEVLEDLASGKPMDRLVCGDVGFGKTEVAMRAAFAVVAGSQKPESRSLNSDFRVQDSGFSHQVALICPTTLLARQHYKNFVERFRGLPVTIRQLSRFVPAREAAETRQMLAEGAVDIVIGTHALLGKQVMFKHLGLVIIDEEQHFGVKQKEKLKQLRTEIHVLALSATPIPRTLQMSLSGVRDLSLITTPPVDRLAVRTYVMPYDPVVLREAILRELYRGGRVFYVCPRIKDLAEVERQLKVLVPEVKIAVAHGKKPAAELDSVMNAFYDGQYQLLLSTNIIESGIDIATANTLIIHRSDMFGLAQLYQLRGRVGRAKVRAYAYLTLPHRRTPTKQAMKRLEVMQSLDTLGAGFTLASYDMDIRGFGNLLGEEQSGNIKEVGVELYQQYLQEAIVAAKAAGVKEAEPVTRFSPHISVGATVLIPEVYVADLDVRLGLYHRLSNLETEQEVEDMAVELIDRFGPLPEEAEHLLDIVKIQILCRALNVDRIDAGPKGMTLSFYENRCPNPEALIGYIARVGASVKLRPDQKIAFTHRAWESPEKRIRGAAQVLRELEKELPHPNPLPLGEG